MVDPFKLMLVGDGGVGKTAFFIRLLTGEFEWNYTPTVGVEVCLLFVVLFLNHSLQQIHPLKFQTTKGEICFDVWDTAGQEKYRGLGYVAHTFPFSPSFIRDSITRGVSVPACQRRFALSTSLFFFFPTSPSNSDGYCINADCGIIMFDVTSRQSYKNVPNWHRDVQRYASGIPLVLVGNKVDMMRSVEARQILFHRKVNMQYYDVSVKSNYNIEKPFLHIAKQLRHDPDLEFTEEVALQVCTTQQ